MSDRIQIVLPMPAISLNISGKYAVINKPSGVAYMLLRIVEFGMETEQKYTISDLMPIFGLPRDMSSFIIGEINTLIDMGMIRPRSKLLSKITENTFIKSLEFTEAGEDIFSNKSVATSIRDININLLYRPGLNQKYSRDLKIEYEEKGHNYDYKEPDNKDVELFIRNSDAYDIKSEDKIYNMSVKKDRARTYIQSVDLFFNRSVGSFNFNNSYDVDTTFLKLNYSGNDIVKVIPDSAFVLDNNLGFEIKRWSDSLPDSDYTSMLPCDFVFEGKILIASSAVNKISKNINSISIPDGLDCDAAIINSAYSAEKIWFVRKDAEIQGFNTSKSVKLVLTQSLSEKEITTLSKIVANNLRFEWSEELSKLDQLSTITHNNDLIFDKIYERCKDGDLDKFKDTLSRINSFKNSNWYLNLPFKLEEFVCIWIDKGMDLEDVIEHLDTILRRDIKVFGNKIIPKMISNYDIIRVSDWAFANNISTDRLISEKLKECIISLILNNSEFTTESDVFKKIKTAANSLDSLKNITGILSTKDYSCDIEQFNEEDAKIIVKISNQLDNTIESLDSIISGTKSPDYGVLNTFLKIFNTIGSALKIKRKFRGRKDYRSEENQLLFYLQLSKKLSFEITRIFGDNNHIQNKIYELFVSNKINKNIFETITEFINSKSRCYYNFLDENISEDNKRKWTDGVFELTNIANL